MFQQKEVEDMFPNGMASRSNKAFQDRLKKHADWTEQSVIIILSFTCNTMKQKA